MKGKTIAVVDDDIYIGDMLEEILTGSGYRVLRAYSGTEALLLLQKENPDLVLLDLMLPGLSGEEVLPRLSNIPVIVISAKADIQSKVDLLLGGAADYLTKPFEVEELLARIQVQLRKSKDSGDSEILRFADLEVDSRTHQVQAGGKPVRLTPTEYGILKLLVQNPSQVMTKSLLLSRLCEETPDCTESSLKVHVSNLRKKLREISGRDYIEAVWGIGFKLREE